MNITLKEQELELEVNKVDTPAGAAWSVKMPDKRKVLIKFHDGKWGTTDPVGNWFVQEIGNAINRLREADQPEKLYNGIRGLT
jgi:hypothetical protein